MTKKLSTKNTDVLVQISTLLKQLDPNMRIDRGVTFQPRISDKKKPGRPFSMSEENQQLVLDRLCRFDSPQIIAAETGLNLQTIHAIKRLFAVEIYGQELVQNNDVVSKRRKKLLNPVLVAAKMEKEMRDNIKIFAKKAKVPFAICVRYALSKLLEVSVESPSELGVELRKANKKRCDI